VNSAEESAATAADSVQVFMMNCGSDGFSIVFFGIVIHCCQ
jgi:hypothetical protein